MLCAGSKSKGKGGAGMKKRRLNRGGQGLTRTLCGREWRAAKHSDGHRNRKRQRNSVLC